MTRVTRRGVLATVGLGTVAVAGVTMPLGQSASTKDWISTGPKPARFARRMPVPQPLVPTVMNDEYGEYHLYEIDERATQAQLLDPGAPATTVLAYAPVNGTPSVPGPLIKVQQNTRVCLKVRNQLPAIHPVFGYPAATSVHLHGSASLPQFDGYADDLTQPSHWKAYWYPNHQGPRTLWYHDHAVHHTAQNVYSGLVAQYHLHNAWEQANLPQGPYDVPLIVSDAMFDSDGNLAYMDRDHAGLYGDVITANGVPWPYFDVEQLSYRFRVLVASKRTTRRPTSGAWVDRRVVWRGALARRPSWGGRV